MTAFGPGIPLVVVIKASFRAPENATENLLVSFGCAGQGKNSINTSPCHVPYYSNIARPASRTRRGHHTHLLGPLQDVDRGNVLIGRHDC